MAGSDEDAELYGLPLNLGRHLAEARAKLSISEGAEITYEQAEKIFHHLKELAEEFQSTSGTINSKQTAALDKMILSGGYILDVASVIGTDLFDNSYLGFIDKTLHELGFPEGLESKNQVTRSERAAFLSKLVENRFIAQMMAGSEEEALSYGLPLDLGRHLAEARAKFSISEDSNITYEQALEIYQYLSER